MTDTQIDLDMSDMGELGESLSNALALLYAHEIVTKSELSKAHARLAKGVTVIDHRDEIMKNEVEVRVTMPGGQKHWAFMDASQFDSPEKVVDEVRAILLRLLTA